MKVINPDRSVLMDVAGVRIDGTRILVTGKIMGAMPMKALIEPAEARKLLFQIGLVPLLRMGWMVLFAKRSPEKGK